MSDKSDIKFLYDLENDDLRSKTIRRLAKILRELLLKEKRREDYKLEKREYNDS